MSIKGERLQKVGEGKVCNAKHCFTKTKIKKKSLIRKNKTRATFFTTLFERKLNELSENVSFDSEFILAFEIQPFKVSFFVFLKCQFFKVFPG